MIAKSEGYFGKGGNEVTSNETFALAVAVDLRSVEAAADEDPPPPPPPPRRPEVEEVDEPPPPPPPPPRR